MSGQGHLEVLPYRMTGEIEERTAMRMFMIIELNEVLLNLHSNASFSSDCKDNFCCRSEEMDPSLFKHGSRYLFQVINKNVNILQNDMIPKRAGYFFTIGSSLETDESINVNIQPSNKLIQFICGK